LVHSPHGALRSVARQSSLTPSLRETPPTCGTVVSMWMSFRTKPIGKCGAWLLPLICKDWGLFEDHSLWHNCGLLTIHKLPLLLLFFWPESGVVDWAANLVG
jgi:hypothetical protein